MAFRDDEEARIARLASLDAENQRLREELEAERAKQRDQAPVELPREELESEKRAAEKRAKREERERRAKERKATRSPKGPLGPKIGIAVMGLAIITFIGIGVKKCGGGRVSITRVTLMDGVLVVERSRSFKRSSRIELVTFDPLTGKQLGELELPGDVKSLSYSRRASSRVWTKIGDRLALIDVRTPAIVVGPDALAKAIPELAGGYRIGDATEGSLALADGSISDDNMWYRPAQPVLLADGTRVWLDPTPRLLRERPDEKPVPRVGYACMYYDVPSCEEKRCLAWAPVEGSSMRELGWFPGWRTSTTARPELYSASGARLHDPVFVKRLDRGCATVIGNGVLVHHQSLAIAPSELQLSLVSTAGPITWTVPGSRLGGKDLEPLGAIADGERVIVVLVDHKRLIDAQTPRYSRIVLAELTRDGKVVAVRELDD